MLFVFSIVNMIWFVDARAAVTAEIGGDLYGIGAHRSVLSSTLNFDNRTRFEAENEVLLDLRPQVQAKFGDDFSLLARPRWRPHWSDVPYPISHRSVSRTDAKFQFDEASLRWDVSPEVRLVAGVHYYMWGPGELMSPSNPLFHFQWDSRSVIFRQRGQVLLRGAWSLNADTSFTALFEPIPNGEPLWLSSAAYTPRFLLRGETNWISSANSAALTLGRMDGGAAFMGTSVSAYLAEGLSFYLDSRHTLGRINPAPDIQSTLPAVVPGEINRGPLETLGLVGVRYEGFFDSRLEYIFNSYGYSAREFQTLLSAARMFPATVGGLGSPGLELPLRNYLFISLRTDRFGSGDELRTALRYLHSLSDHSGAFFGANEWSFADRWTWIAECGFTHGPPNSEFRLSYAWELRSSFRFAL